MSIQNVQPIDTDFYQYALDPFHVLNHYQVGGGGGPSAAICEGCLAPTLIGHTCSEGSDGFSHFHGSCLRQCGCCVAAGQSAAFTLSRLLIPRSSLEHAFFLKPLLSTHKQTDYIIYPVGIPQDCKEYSFCLDLFAG